MEVAEGYKDTKVGRVPKDWEVVKLGETCEFLRGQSFAKSEIIEGGKNECIHYGELFTVYSELIKTIYSKTDSEIIRNSEVGDILMPSSDVTPTGLATASVINKKGVLIGGDVNIIRPLVKLDSNFLSYLMNYEKKKIIRLISGTNVKHIYNQNLKTLRYALPSFFEQQKIAEILSTVDEQISTTQAIIDKSKELKKGLMQKLFSEGIGHTEFKDTKIGRIPKDWEVVRLGEISEIKGRIGFRGYTRTDLVKKGEGALTIGAKHINKGNKLDFSIPEYISWEKYEESPEIKVEVGHILIVQRGSIGKIALVNELPEPATINPSMVLVKKVNCNKIFLFQWLIGYTMQSLLYRETSSTSIPMISQKQIKDFRIPLPPLPEQQKIATILSEADAKIEKEQTQKAHLEQLKKGLMQQLLTGKKRVKV